MEKNLSIVLPVYNEKDSLSLMVKILNSTLEFNNEIIIVYDYENDNSVPIAKKLQSKFNNIILVHNKYGRGVKYAIKAGIEKSNYNNILITAVDEIFPILSINKMITMITDENYDFVSGTRYANGGKRIGGSFIGHILSRIANKSFCIITKFPLSDLTTGIKMFRKNFYENIEINTNPVGWVFAFELSIKAYLMNYKVGEVPLISIDRLFGGESTFKFGKWVIEYFKCYMWGLKKILLRK
jgi:dolichol-phosphate mannosyltransferase